MSIRRYRTDFERLGDETLNAWRELPTAVIGDSLDRSGCMSAGIKSIRAGTRIAGQARTVTTMVGDNSTLHVALGLLEPGQILVADAGGADSVAVWGGVMTEAAMARRVGGVVIDGAIRDVDELRRNGFALFCRAVTPRGPHKGFGGTIDGVIAAGGVAVSPGDIIVGDDDGVVVVPLARAAAVLTRAREHIEKEKSWIAAIRAGRSTREVLGLPEPEMIEPGPATGTGR